MRLFELLPHGPKFGDATLADDFERFARKHMLTTDAQLELSGLLARLQADAFELQAGDYDSRAGVPE